MKLSMKLLYFSFIIIGANAFYVDNNDSNLNKKEKIVGGNKAGIEYVPYQAQLVQNDRQICGATIIAKHWLLTAGHCIVGANPKLSVITGSSNVSTGGELHRVVKIIVHANYNPETQNNDIALLKVQKPIIFNKRQQAVKIATRFPKTHDVMLISGYGKQGEDLGYSVVLEVATVPVVDYNDCNEMYKKANESITINMFCAGEGKTDACQGDSGGPGVIDGELAGVVSAGMECGSKFFPGLYTIVFKYRDWIRKNTKLPTL